MEKKTQEEIGLSFVFLVSGTLHNGRLNLAGMVEASGPLILQWIPSK